MTYILLEGLLAFGHLHAQVLKELSCDKTSTFLKVIKTGFLKLLEFIDTIFFHVIELNI